MKLRLEKDTVRFRLSAEEVGALKAEGKLTEHLHITKENCYTYTLRLSEDADRCVVTFNDKSLEVIIPEFAASKWMNSNQVGIKETIVTDNGNQMTLFVEEDLPRKRKEKQ